MLQKTDDTNFVRDASTNALINTNVAAYNQYKQQRKHSMTVENLCQDVERLKDDLSDIKQLLGQILQNVGTNK